MGSLSPHAQDPPYSDRQPTQDPAGGTHLTWGPYLRVYRTPAQVTLTPATGHAPRLSIWGTSQDPQGGRASQQSLCGECRALAGGLLEHHHQPLRTPAPPPSPHLLPAPGAPRVCGCSFLSEKEYSYTFKTTDINKCLFSIREEIISYKLQN